MLRLINSHTVRHSESSTRYASTSLRRISFVRLRGLFLNRFKILISVSDHYYLYDFRFPNTTHIANPLIRSQWAAMIYPCITEHEHTRYIYPSY